MAEHKIAANKAASPRVHGKPVKAWSFPKVPLEEAIRIPRAIDDKFGGNPAPAQELARAVGFRQSKDWRFLDILRAANQYGLVSGTGATARVALEPIGQDIVAPSSPKDRQEALRRAFRNVEDFARVEDYYRGKRLPDDEYFLNTLSREFKVDRDRVQTFSTVFRVNDAFLRSFAVEPYENPVTSEPNSASFPELAGASSATVPRVREFLDTCFVMMPFGTWFDRYYQEIYVPAIKEAGYEPRRADELFTTGSVVEQIWEEIERASVLLADLTDKNPNVFYELGLSHADCKPVIFTAGRLEDVPFDLRHLRVIIYEVRAPRWAQELQESITKYLKYCRDEPEKSIPQPFREIHRKRSRDEA
jgi:hypothetical protein